MRAICAGLLAALAVGSVVLTGCGGSDGGSSASSRNVDLLIADCSKSFRKSSERLLPVMDRIASDSAEQRHVFWAGCFAGAPLRTLAWEPKVDFGQTLDELPATDETLERLAAAQALGLRSRLKQMVLKTPATEGGSGQLEALEVASQAPHVDRIFFITDAAIHEPEVPELATATKDELRKTVNLWAPRLQGLRGTDLIMLGAGYGVHNSASVRAARYLFGSLAKRTGTASFSWTQELPPAFGTVS